MIFKKSNKLATVVAIALLTKLIDSRPIELTPDPYNQVHASTPTKLNIHVEDNPAVNVAPGEDCNEDHNHIEHELKWENDHYEEEHWEEPEDHQWDEEKNQEDYDHEETSEDPEHYEEDGDDEKSCEDPDNYHHNEDEEPCEDPDNYHHHHGEEENDGHYGHEHGYDEDCEEEETEEVEEEEEEEEEEEDDDDHGDYDPHEGHRHLPDDECDEPENGEWKAPEEYDPHHEHDHEPEEPSEGGEVPEEHHHENSEEEQVPEEDIVFDPEEQENSRGTIDFGDGRITHENGELYEPEVELRSVVDNAEMPLFKKDGSIQWPDAWCEKECRETMLLYEGCTKQGELVGESCVCSAHFRYKVNKCKADGCEKYYEKAVEWHPYMDKYEAECKDKGDDFVDY